MTKTRVLRLAEVMEITGMKRSSLYASIAEGDFPRPLSLGNRQVGWADSTIEKWIQKKIKESEQL